MCHTTRRAPAQRAAAVGEVEGLERRTQTPKGKRAARGKERRRIGAQGAALSGAHAAALVESAWLIRGRAGKPVVICTINAAAPALTETEACGLRSILSKFDSSLTQRRACINSRTLTMWRR